MFHYRFHHSRVNKDTQGRPAQEFLLQTLADGPKPALEVFADADKLHIARGTLRGAKGDLGVLADKTPDHWEWSLPRPQGDASGSQDAQAILVSRRVGTGWAAAGREIG